MTTDVGVSKVGGAGDLNSSFSGQQVQKPDPREFKRRVACRHPPPVPASIAPRSMPSGPLRAHFSPSPLLNPAKSWILFSTRVSLPVTRNQAQYSSDTGKQIVQAAAPDSVPWHPEMKRSYLNRFYLESYGTRREYLH